MSPLPSLLFPILFHVTIHAFHAILPGLENRQQSYGVQGMARAFLPVSQHHATPYAAGMVFVTVMQQIMHTADNPPEPKRFGLQNTVGGGVAFLDYFLTEEGKNREIYRCKGRNRRKLGLELVAIWFCMHVQESLYMEHSIMHS